MKRLLVPASICALAACADVPLVTAWNGERAFSNEVSVTIGTKLSGAQGLEKWGAGELVITGVDHDYTGDVLLAGGNTRLKGANDVMNVQTGGLGNPRVARTLMVTNGAALTIEGANAIGGAGTSVSPILSELHVADATINFQKNFSCNLGDVYFHNAAITYEGGFGFTWRHWGTMLCRNLYFSGTQTYNFPKNGTRVNGTNNPDNNCGLLIGKWAPDRMGEIRVPDLSGNASTDVFFGWSLFWCADNANTQDGCLGSFRKTGAGTLELGSATSNIRGNVRVEEGVLKLSGGAAQIGVDRSVLGNPLVARTNTVCAGATLWLNASDQQGQMYNDSKLVTYVKGGTLRQNENCSNGMGPVILEDATLSYAGHPASTYWPATKNADGSWTTNSPTPSVSTWGTFAFNGGLWVKGTKPLSMPNNRTSNGTWSCLYFGANGMSDVRVDDVTGDAASDLTIGMRILDGGPWCQHDAQRIVKTNHVATVASFRKCGPGTLELKDDASHSEFTGPVEVSEGVLKINYSSSDWNRFYSDWSPLGSTRLPHVITVHSGGELQFATADIMGQLSKHCPGPTLVLSNGTLRLNNACCNGLPNLRLFNGTLAYTGGSSGARNWGLFGFNGLAEFDGDRAYDLPNGTANNWISLGYGTDFTAATNAAGTAVLYRGCTEFRVHDVTGNADVDVTIRPVLQDLPDWPTRTSNDTVVGKGRPVYFSCGLRKTGAGALRLTNSNIYTGATEVVEGALLVDSPSSKSPVTVKAGGLLGGAGVVPSATLEAGAGFTAAPGQTGSLTLNAVTLPADGEVRLDVPFTGDWEELAALRVPVVKAAGLASATWRVTVNGQPAPAGFRASAVVVDGIVHGQVARSGLTVIIR